ncbi:MAG: hypothetical protein ACI8Y7_000718 [Candidatus Woesearchaeota archaeon]|jgi:hypothetical protein
MKSKFSIIAILMALMVMSSMSVIAQIPQDLLTNNPTTGWIFPYDLANTEDTLFEQTGRDFTLENIDSFYEDWNEIMDNRIVELDDYHVRILSAIITWEMDIESMQEDLNNGGSTTQAEIDAKQGELDQMNELYSDYLLVELFRAEDIKTRLGVDQGADHETLDPLYVDPLGDDPMANP